MMFVMWLFTVKLKPIPISGDVATVAGEAGLPFAGLVGLGLKLGARIFRSDQMGEENIKFIG